MSRGQAHRNLSQLPSFAFSLPLAMFLLAQEESTDTQAADAQVDGLRGLYPPNCKNSTFKFELYLKQVGSVQSLLKNLCLYIIVVICVVLLGNTLFH